MLMFESPPLAGGHELGAEGEPLDGGVRGLGRGRALTLGGNEPEPNQLFFKDPGVFFKTP